ncbi:MAG: alkaline phosphatase PhoX, partial [Verrucomicrobiota bacterium]
FEDNSRIPEDFDRSLCYDPGRHGAQPFVGGTTTIVYDTIRKQVIDEYLSLFGTDRNCAGGPTPWGSWITCEEPADMTTRWGVHHGYCFEVAADHRGLADPIPLRGLGRFRHEAIAVSENSGIIYLTEDRPDGAIYRFIPSMPKDLTGEGRLQALAIREKPRINTTNWPGGDTSFPIAERIPAEWVDLDDVESAKDDLRIRARQKGAALFSRAEGMWYGSAEVVGESSIYWACTDGGASHFGQIFRYFPGDSEGAEGKNGDYGEIELYLEPNDSKLLQNGDNITIAPSGHLYIAEDSSGPCCLQGVSKEGELFTFARNRLNSSELAGVCFSPDGSTLFCNIQKPGITLAITGPFV